MPSQTSPKRLFNFFAAFTCGLLTLSSHAAYADEPRAAQWAAPSAPEGAQPPEVALMHVMEAELDLFAARAKSQRTATVITTAVSAVALVPAGYVLSRRSDSLSQAIGVGMTIGGAVPLLPMLFAFRSSGTERVRDAFEERRASAMARADVLRLTEADWERTASAAHNRRIVIGLIDLALGTACTAAGLYFLLSDPVAKMDRNDQTTLGSSLVGPGVPLATFGIRSLLQESIEETSWDAYRATKVLADPQPPARAEMPALSVAPLRGGAAAVATYAF